MQRAVGDGHVPWSLVAAVAREESRWNPEAVSSVGARGLMQLMPATAAGLSTRLEQATGAPTDLFDPSVALRLGTAELQRLLDEFDGFTPAVVAAYNAGEAQARLWLDQCGTGCDETSYVAAISFGATRSYTADVLWAASMYRELDGESKLVVTVRTP
jgi:soluble lytic murein transglycosylase